MGRWGIRGLKTRVGWKCSISRRRARLYSAGIDVGKSEERVTVLRVGTQQLGSSKSESRQEFRIWRGRVVRTLDGPIWSRCSIALTCFVRSHF